MAMRKESMPQARQDRPAGASLQWDLTPSAAERWVPDLHAASEEPDATISILDPIGFDPWTGEGVTAKRIAAALRAIGASNPVTVNINSPGGDLWEGMAIYNLFRDHGGKVTTRVLGIAASAASIVAMAGDEILIARAAFLMMHNSWVVAIGNRNDLREVADMLEPFDASMADIYATRSGTKIADVQKMMDAETFIGGAAAIEQGFADALMPADEVKKDKSASAKDRLAAHVLDTALARTGVPRSQRRSLLQDFKDGTGTPSAAANDGTRDAAGTGTPSATDQGGTRDAASDALAALQLRNACQHLSGSIKSFWSSQS